MLEILDFFAEWCGPCKAIAPILSEIETDYSDKVSIKKINVEDSSDLAQQYRVRNIPLLVFLKDGNVVKRIVGATTKENIINTIDDIYNGTNIQLS